jgi:CPA2 family monovalent cation:H+ antiporter-2
MSGLGLTLVLLLAAVLGVALFRLAHLPPPLAYLTVGALIGPLALGLAPDNPLTRELGETGVVFLMFSIGLEFNLARFKALGIRVFGLGLAEVGAIIALTVVLGVALPVVFSGAPRAGFAGWFALGAALSMSSTAIVVRLLVDRLEIDAPHGQQVIGVLLLQDLAVVVLLVVIPALAGDREALVATSLVVTAKVACLFLLLLVFGQRLTRAWLRIVARRRSQELFMLNLLLMTLGLAWVTERAGLSLALGSFIAGMLISETEYRHQVEADIKPFRDVLLGLFFISIGMQLNARTVLAHLPLVLLLLILPALVKFGLIALLSRAFGSPGGVAIRTALALMAAGEFGFVLLSQARILHLIDAELYEPVVAALLLSMLLAPLVIHYSEAIAVRLSSSEWLRQSLALTEIASRTMRAEAHVVVCGFGRSGQSLCRLLAEEGISYVALDLDPDRVREASEAGQPVVYGDATRRDVLVAAGVVRASALVITFAHVGAAHKVLNFARALAPGLPVIVRTHDDSALDALQQSGATEVVPEIIEGSLMLASQTLLLLGVPVARVLRTIRSARESRYHLMRGFFRGATDSESLEGGDSVRLHAVTLPAHARVVGQSIAEIDWQGLVIEITSIRRRGIAGLDPGPEARLEANDVVVLRGEEKTLYQAEEILLAR